MAEHFLDFEGECVPRPVLIHLSEPLALQVAKAHLRRHGKGSQQIGSPIQTECVKLAFSRASKLLSQQIAV